MSGRSPRPDFGRTDYRFKINDNFGMLHETTLIRNNITLEITVTSHYNHFNLLYAWGILYVFI